MTGNGPRGGRGWSGWREVVAAWAVAGLLAGSLLLLIPRHDTQGPSASLSSLNPAAASRAYYKTPDPEGPASDETCSDRDYANELC
jgi:hypothetical protein